MATTGQEALTAGANGSSDRIFSPWEMQVLSPQASKIDFTWAPPLFEQPIHAGRHVRIVCIGAGFSGLCAAIHLQKDLENFDLQIYDKNEDVGGVWQINRYPGVACDVPSHTYQYTFCENTKWSAFYAPGSEIQGYLAKVAEHYDLRKLIKLSHEVVSATWNAEAGKWTIEVKDLATGEVHEDVADFVIHGTGLLSKPQWPSIPGLHDFKGYLRHSGTWDAAKDEATEGFEWSDLRVGVIGNGASGVQIVPTLQKKAKQVLNFGRSKVWLSAGYGSGALNQLRPGGNDGSNYYFSEAEQERFQQGSTYNTFRQGIEAELASSHHLTLQGNTFQEGFRVKLTSQMRGKTKAKPQVAEAMLPDFPVGCKRLTPGPGYLESLCEKNAELITAPIERITERGVMTADGVEHELDMIVCATGFDVRLLPQFPISGLGGVKIQDAWAKETRSYLGITASELPNSFNLLTTQAAVGSGSVLTTLERQCEYLTKVIGKCQREHYRSVVVKPQAVTDFLKYTDDYFKRTVYATNCKSWYKLGQAGEATIRSIWPGSGLHAFLALKYPRWEDYEWERMPEMQHSMSWLGNGDVSPELDRHFAYGEMRAAHGDTVLW